MNDYTPLIKSLATQAMNKSYAADEQRDAQGRWSARLPVTPIADPSLEGLQLATHYGDRHDLAKGVAVQTGEVYTLHNTHLSRPQYMAVGSHECTDTKCVNAQSKHRHALLMRLGATSNAYESPAYVSATHNKGMEKELGILRRSGSFGELVGNEEHPLHITNKPTSKPTKDQLNWASTQTTETPHSNEVGKMTRKPPFERIHPSLIAGSTFSELSIAWKKASPSERVRLLPSLKEAHTHYRRLEASK